MNKVINKKIISIYIAILIPALIIIDGCGDPPSEMPSPVQNVGSLEITGSIRISPDTIRIPDPIYISLDGEYLGSFANHHMVDGVSVGVHVIDVSFDFRDEHVNSPQDTVEVRFNEVTAVEITVKTGGVDLLHSIEISPDSSFQPDSVGIIWDGDSLGYQPNPFSRLYVPEGDHEIAAYCRFEERDFIIPARTVSVTYNRITEWNLVMSAGGVLIVNATFNDQQIEEFGVILDGLDLGIGESPRVIPNISEGLHKLVVHSEIDTTQLEDWKQNLEVTLAETTRVELTLQVVAPFVGSHAPNIDCIDIDGNSYNLFDHWGEVIYLYFFEHT